MNFKQNKWLIIGALCYIGVSLLTICDCMEETVGLDLFYSLLLIGSLLSHLWFYYIFFKEKQIYNVEQLFGDLISFGLLSLGLSFLPDISVLGIKKYETIWLVTQLIGYYGGMHFILVLFFSYRKLGGLNETELVRQQWNPFLLVVALTTIGYLMGISIPSIVVDVITLMGLLMGLFLVFKIKWIAYINSQSKWLSILFLLIINLVLIGMLQNLWSYELPYLIIEPTEANAFYVLLLGFIFFYGVVSVGGLLFNIPIASVTEQRAAEIESYQTINRSIMRKDSIQDTFKLLFKTCHNDTKASAGWLILEQKKGINETTVYTSEITEEEVSHYNKIIDLEAILADKEKLEKHYYYKEIKPTEQEKYQSLLVFPVITNRTLLGTICLAKISQGAFDEYQIQLAQSYIDQATLSFENTVLLKKTIESERYKQELNIARRVQKQLIPQIFPKTDFFEMDGLSESALEVGGDYCDFIEMEDGRLSLIVADVAGHGASAAFYMAHLKGIYQSLTQFDLSVEDFLKYTNDALSRCLERRVFITLTYALFDFEEQKMVYARAGHTPVLYYNSAYDEATFLEDEGMGLGVLRDHSYDQYIQAYEQKFEEGDIFVLFTDGIIEGRNPTSREEFGEERLKMCVQNHADTSVTTLKRLILQNFYDFIENTDRTDDHTIILVKIR